MVVEQMNTYVAKINHYASSLSTFSLFNLLQKVRSSLVLTKDDYLLVGLYLVATSVPKWNKGFLLYFFYLLNINSLLYTYLQQKPVHHLKYYKLLSIDQLLKSIHLIQTIAVIPMPAFGVALFGSMQKVSILVFGSNFHTILTEKTTHDHKCLHFGCSRNNFVCFSLKMLSLDS